MPAYERNQPFCGCFHLFHVVHLIVLHVNVLLLLLYVHTAGVSSGRMILIILKSFVSAIVVLTHVYKFFVAVTAVIVVVLHALEIIKPQIKEIAMIPMSRSIVSPFSWFLIIFFLSVVGVDISASDIVSCEP